MSFVSGVEDSVGTDTLIRVTGPVAELRRRVRRRSEPPLPGSAILNKLFLTVYPTACIVDWLEYFPFQKNNVVLLLQGTRVCKSCFLESSNVHVQSFQIIVNDSCLPGVLDVLETCGEAGHHCPDIPATQF